jgi:hypothetical protein
MWNYQFYITPSDSSLTFEEAREAAIAKADGYQKNDPSAFIFVIHKNLAFNIEGVVCSGKAFNYAKMKNWVKQQADYQNTSGFLVNVASNSESENVSVSPDADYYIKSMLAELQPFMQLPSEPLTNTAITEEYLTKLLLKEFNVNKEELYNSALQQIVEYFITNENEIVEKIKTELKS